MLGTLPKRMRQKFEFARFLSLTLVALPKPDLWRFSAAWARDIGFSTSSKPMVGFTHTRRISVNLRSYVSLGPPCGSQCLRICLALVPLCSLALSLVYTQSFIDIFGAASRASNFWLTNVQVFYTVSWQILSYDSNSPSYPLFSKSPPIRILRMLSTLSKNTWKT